MLTLLLTWSRVQQVGAGGSAEGGKQRETELRLVCKIQQKECDVLL